MRREMITFARTVVRTRAFRRSVLPGGAAADELVVVGGGEQPAGRGEGDVERGERGGLVVGFERELGHGQPLDEVVELLGRHLPSFPHERPDPAV